MNYINLARYSNTSVPCFILPVPYFILLPFRSVPFRKVYPTWARPFLGASIEIGSGSRDHKKLTFCNIFAWPNLLLTGQHCGLSSLRLLLNQILRTHPIVLLGLCRLMITNLKTLRPCNIGRHPLLPDHSATVGCY